jgi:hypothetical protein
MLLLCISGVLALQQVLQVRGRLQEFLPAC